MSERRLSGSSSSARRPGSSNYGPGHTGSMRPGSSQHHTNSTSNDPNDGFSNTADDTLSRGNLISEFLRIQGSGMKGLSQEEFLSKYEAFVRETEEKKSAAVANSSLGSTLNTSSQETKESDAIDIENAMPIVLKFTTLSDGSMEAPAFTVNGHGATIGRSTSNTIPVPSDTRMVADLHASIIYRSGSYYLVDHGHDFAASVRIGVGNNASKRWYLEPLARFSAGNSVFQSNGLVTAENVSSRKGANIGDLEIEALEGPLRSEKFYISKRGATFGRSSDNTVVVPDRELSRRHSRIDYDERSGRFIVSDMGSTNGTYIQLVGPYGPRYRLSLNDHILVGRTGFSINRYDYGLSEEIGHRPSMEDACTIVQHLNISQFNIPELSPQSFFGVFDGHGGSNASAYLSQHLHVNVTAELMKSTVSIIDVLNDTASGKYGAPVVQDGNNKSTCNLFNCPPALNAFDNILRKIFSDSFNRTDTELIQHGVGTHGSTATTALLLGKRLYCANVGDSRTMLCRDFTPYLLSEDHKPTREDEAKRIQDAGGFVIRSRVMGELAISRAFGDQEFKSTKVNSGAPSASGAPSDGEGSWEQSLVIPEPEVKVTTVTERDQFLLLACDGLFDVFTPEEVVTFVRKAMSDHGDAQRCCQQLTHEAIAKRHSRDNVSVILIILNKWY